MKIHTYTLKNDNGVKNSQGDWVIFHASTGDRLIFIDYEPEKSWPHHAEYILIQSNGGSICNRRGTYWPPDLSDFKIPTLDRVFSQIALLEVLLNMGQEGKEVPLEQAEACVASLKDFRKKYNAWKLTT
jgi:hypothetical protein